MIKWKKVADGIPPLDKFDACDRESTGPLLGWNGEEMLVMSFCRFFDDDQIECFTRCSECWNITGTITHWAPIAPPTEGQE